MQAISLDSVSRRYVLLNTLAMQNHARYNGKQHTELDEITYAELKTTSDSLSQKDCWNHFVIMPDNPKNKHPSLEPPTNTADVNKRNILQYGWEYTVHGLVGCPSQAGQGNLRNWSAAASRVYVHGEAKCILGTRVLERWVTVKELFMQLVSN